jgi:hypothetical protein
LPNFSTSALVHKIYLLEANKKWDAPKHYSHHEDLWVGVKFASDIQDWQSVDRVLLVLNLCSSETRDRLLLPEGVDRLQPDLD